MTSYKVGQLSALMNNSSSASEKQRKKTKKLQLLFSTPLPNHKESLNKSQAHKRKGDSNMEQFNLSISPIGNTKKKIKKSHKNFMDNADKSQDIMMKKKKKKDAKMANPETSDKRTKKKKNHLQKVDAPEEKVESKDGAVQTKKQKTEECDRDKEVIKIDDGRSARTVFVGNLPTSFDKEGLKSLFKQFGKVESARIRSAAPLKASIPKKVAVIKQQYHPDVHSFNGFVVFETEEMAHAALELNGREIKGHHLRINIANRKQEHDHQRSVFVGNLRLDVKDDDLWDFFQECGEIRQVRTIKDRETRIGKGFGYVLFKTVDAAALALEKNGEELNGRPLRISRSMKRERKPPRTKYSQGACENTRANKTYQGARAKERFRSKKNKKLVKNKLRLKKKKMLAQKLQSGLTKASSR